jgi:hypothetical protein
MPWLEAKASIDHRYCELLMEHAVGHTLLVVGMQFFPKGTHSHHVEIQFHLKGSLVAAEKILFFLGASPAHIEKILLHIKGSPVHAGEIQLHIKGSQLNIVGSTSSVVRSVSLVKMHIVGCPKHTFY